MTAQRINRLKIAAAALVVLAIGIGAGYRWANHLRSPEGQTPARSSASSPAEEGAKRERRILYWHDPMFPNSRFDKPGKSPFMDMQLVPVYANEPGRGGSVRVNANVVQNLGIRLGNVEKATFDAQLRAVGSVAFDESSLELVQPRVEGTITRLHVKAPLTQVKRGQALATVVAPQWLEAEQEYLAFLDARSPSAQAIRDAARQRLTVLGIPAATIRAIETKRKTEATATFVAPVDGVVTEMDAREGAVFAPGASLFRINGLDTVWVNAQVPESELSRIPVGSTVETVATAWPGMTFSGRVIALLPQLDAQTRAIPVRVVLDNAGHKLAPGMFVSLIFSAPVAEPQLVVPSEAVITTGERNVVILAREDGSFDVADVTLGPEQAGRTVVLSGLAEGQVIVRSGQFLIDSEASLKSALGRIQSAAAPQPMERRP